MPAALPLRFISEVPTSTGPFSEVADILHGHPTRIQIILQVTAIRAQLCEVNAIRSFNLERVFNSLRQCGSFGNYVNNQALYFFKAW